MGDSQELLRKVQDSWPYLEGGELSRIYSRKDQRGRMYNSYMGSSSWPT